MQISSYLFNPEIVSYVFNPQILATVNKPNTVRNTTVLNRQLRIYKGADNLVDFVVNDFDLQPLTVNQYTFKFTARDRYKNIIIEKNIPLRVGYTNRLALDILESDLETVNLGRYIWGMSVVMENNKERPVYLAANGNAEGSMEIVRWIGT